MPDPDLLAPLAPAPAEAARLVGTIDGPPGWDEGFGAGLRCWCGPHHGWRDLGELRSIVGCVVSHRGRLGVSITFDLGPGPARPIRAAEEDADA
jgi:hypothetical protein